MPYNLHNLRKYQISKKNYGWWTMPQKLQLQKVIKMSLKLDLSPSHQDDHHQWPMVRSNNCLCFFVGHVLSLWSIVEKVTRLPRKWTARNVPCLQNMKIIALISISILPFEQWKSEYKNLWNNQMPWAPGLIFPTLNIVQNANWAFLVCFRPVRCKTLVNIPFYI